VQELIDFALLFKENANFLQVFTEHFLKKFTDFGLVDVRSQLVLVDFLVELQLETAVVLPTETI